MQKKVPALSSVLAAFIASAATSSDGKSITGSEVTKPSRSENLVVSEAAKDAVTTKSQKLKSAVTPPARNAEMQLCVGGVNKSAQPVKPATALMSACAATMGMCGRR